MNTTASFTATMAALNDALSLIPITRMLVITRAMARAGRSSVVPVALRVPNAGSKSNGAFVNAIGSLTPNIPMKS